MQPRLSRVSAILLIASAACVAGDRSFPLGPAFVISDGMHAGGTPGFYFLPPMVTQPTVAGVFDADIATVNPVVVICDVSVGPDTDCGGATPALRTFTTTSTPPIRVESDKYTVNWDTKEGAFSAGRTYRLHVLGGTPTRELGFADILLTNEPGKAKNLAGGDLIVLNDGRTLPIHFRIERGVIVPAGPAVSLDVTGLSDPTVAGTVSGVTVTARDANGNIATGYAGTIAFTSTDPQAELPGEYTFTAGDEGVRSFPAGVTFKTAGIQTLQATDAAEPGIAGSVSVTVGPAAAAELRFTTRPTDAAAGSSLAPPVVITAFDEFGNLATDFTGPVSVAIGINPAPGGGVLAGTLEVAAALGVATFDGLRINTAGTGYTLLASATGLTGATSEPFDITALNAVSLQVSGLSDPTTAGTVSSITVTARDEHGNVDAGYTGTIAFTSTDPQATLPAEYTFTAGDAGSHTFPASVTLRTAGSAAVTATDQAVATITGAQTVVVVAAAAAELVLAGIPDPTVAGVAHDLTVTTRDAFGNTATGYAGTVQFTSTDPVAMLPAAYQFQPADAGVRTFPAGVTLKTAGIQTLQANDAAVPAIAGNISLTVAPAAAAELRFTTQPAEASEDAVIAPPVVVTAYDEFGNTATGFTGQVTIAIGTNPAAGVLSGTLQQTAALGVVTFDGLSIDAAGTGYTLVASATGLTGATSDAFVITAVQPTEVHWINPLGGLWSVGANWSTGVAPAPEQAVLIDLTATYTVTLDVNATVRSLTLGAASGIQTLAAGSGRTLTLATSGTILSTGRMALTSATVNGAGVLTNAGGTLSLSQTNTINTALVNAGTLAAGVPPFSSFNTINGPFTTVAGSLVRVHAGGSNSATLTVASGFTNHGTIELTKASDVSGEARLVVTNGTLVNAPDGTIRSLLGSGGGRTLGAQLDNQGTVILDHLLAITGGSADHLNSGTIQVSGGNLTVTQSGTGPSFTNTGTVTVAAGRTWTISGGSFTHAGGAILDGGGAMTLSSVTAAAFGSSFALGTLTLSSSTANFGVNVSTATMALSLTNATLTGTGTLTNAAGRTISLSGTNTINTALVNAGTLTSGVPPFASFNTINGPFTTVAGSLVRVHAGGSNSATLTVASGFTNHGTIELTKASDVFGEARLVVTNGTLVNASDGTIRSLLGSGGGRRITAQLDNQGTVTLDHVLVIDRGSAVHASSGTVNVQGGTLTVTHSGTTPAFTNTGTITLASGTAFVNGGGTGTFRNGAGGQILGAGVFQTNSGTALANSGSITNALVRIGGALTSDAPAGFAPTTTEFIGSTSQIPVGAGFAYTNIRLATTAPSISFLGSYELPGFLAVTGSSNLAIGAHEILVEGDFSTTASGRLTMQNVLGILNVRGNATFGGGSTNGQLTAGSLRFGGNLTQSGGSAAAFAASVNHVAQLDGSGQQTVFFANPGAATTLSHFQRLAIVNFEGSVLLTSATFANGRLSTPVAQARVIRSAGLTLTAGGLGADGLIFDGTPLRVVNGDVITQFANATFRNMDPTVTQLRLDRLADAVTFNNITFESVPSTGLYLHLVDTDGGGTLFTVTMSGTQPPNHGGKVIESVAGQLVGWPF